MDYAQFLESLDKNSPPDNFSFELKSLWHDAKGNWDKAHKIAQDIKTKNGSLIHAYLHRKEGDAGNAGYWYSRAGAT